MKQALYLHAALTGALMNLTGDTSGLRGSVADDLKGNVMGLTGDVTGLHGDVTGIRGDIDSCELTQEEREKGVDVASLVAGFVTAAPVASDPVKDDTAPVVVDTPPQT